MPVFTTKSEHHYRVMESWWAALMNHGQVDVRHLPGEEMYYGKNKTSRSHVMLWLVFFLVLAFMWM